MTQSFEELVDRLQLEIEPVSEEWRATARARLDALTKPLGSLGRLEDLAAQIVAIRRDDWQQPSRKGVFVFAADHGVTAESVSAYPREVTHQMVLNYLRGGAAVNVLARLHSAQLRVVDMGVDAELEGSELLLNHKVQRGTRNMRREPAMSSTNMQQALMIGVNLADQSSKQGLNMIAVGEMGIGNTTAASAITCLLTGAPAQQVTGRGTGLDAAARIHKVRIVEEIIALHAAHATPARPLEILRCVGGLEIAAMTGMMLQTAVRHGLILLDGFISTAAAALAAAIVPAATGYMVASHRSEEPGHGVLLESLSLQPLLSLGMRLGEGTGAVLAMPIVEAAMALYSGMATFHSAGVSEALP